MFLIRITLLILWLFFCCILGLFGCLLRWGDPNLDRYFGRLFAWGATRICGLRIQVDGAEHLEAQKPCIYVANHQSGIDMATFGVLYPYRTVVVGKKELRWIPFFGLFFVAAGNIVINRQKRVSAIASLDIAADQVRERQVSVWIFPEGTRNRSSDLMMPFKKGAFYLALRARVPIVPIVCSPIGELVSWDKKILRSGSVRIRVLPPVPTEGRSDKEVDVICEQVRVQMTEALAELQSQGR